MELAKLRFRIDGGAEPELQLFSRDAGGVLTAVRFGDNYAATAARDGAMWLLDWVRECHDAPLQARIVKLEEELEQAIATAEGAHRDAAQADSVVKPYRDRAAMLEAENRKLYDKIKGMEARWAADRAEREAKQPAEVEGLEEDVRHLQEDLRLAMEEIGRLTLQLRRK